VKPLGPIPAGYAAIDGELAIGGRKASDLVAQAGRTPLFVYSADLLRQRAAELRAVMPELHLILSLKARQNAPSPLPHAWEPSPGSPSG